MLMDLDELHHCMVLESFAFECLTKDRRLDQRHTATRSRSALKLADIEPLNEESKGVRILVRKPHCTRTVCVIKEIRKEGQLVGKQLFR